MRGTVTLDSLHRVIDHFRTSEWQADLILLTGDLIQDESKAAYEHFRPLLQDFGLPVLGLPGNHDKRQHMRAVFSEPPFLYCDSYDAGAWRLICLDTCVPGEAGGRVGPDELARLRLELAETKAEHIMICLHHPPIDTGSRWLDSVGLADADALLEALSADERVRIVLGGHVHQAIDRTVGGIRVVTTPSTCSQFKPESDKFAVDDSPPAYRKIRLHADGRFESKLAWVNVQDRFHDVD